MTVIHESRAEIPPIIPVETKDQAAIRLQKTLPIISGPIDAHIPHARVYAVGYPKHGGGYSWSANFLRPEGAMTIDPEAGSEEAKLFDEGINCVRTDASTFKILTTFDGRWWQNSKIEDDVQTSLKEVFSLQAQGENGEKRVLEILNCADSRLTDDEIELVRVTIEQVARFTNGKIYDRINGIVFASDSAFDDHDMGGFQGASGVMCLNLDELRKAKGMIPPRYLRYFKDRADVNGMSITLAHEFGHAMDVRSMDEVEAHFIHRAGRAFMALGGVTLEFSAYDNLPGWKATRVPEEHGLWDRDHWSYDVTIGDEFGEHPPTSYGHESPKEDFAESFAIAALGGDLSKMRGRAKLVGETIKRAHATEFDTHTVSIEPVDLSDGVYSPHRLRALQVEVCLVK
jgi:hypothetical protein